MSESYSGTYLIWGPPGAGKTTYLTKQVQTIVDRQAEREGGGNPTPVLVCSLTKAAAAEIAGRNSSLPKSQIGTLHALAYRNLGCPPIAETKIDEWNDHAAKLTSGRALQLGAGEHMKADPDDPNYERMESSGPGDGLLEDLHLYRNREVPTELWRASVREFADEWEAWKTQNEYVDFTDMIAQAVAENMAPPGRPSVVIGDEAQDYSKLEYRLCQQFGRHAGALMLAGDPDQNLYSWRGADPDIFLDPSVPESHRRVLKQSYRVPRAVQQAAIALRVDFSNWQPLEYFPRDEEGMADRLNVNWKRPERVVDEAVHKVSKGESAMILTTCAYMLQPLIQILRKRGIPFANPWRRKRGDWNPLGDTRGVSMRQRLLAFLGEINKRPDTKTPEEQVTTFGQLAMWVKILAAEGVLNRGAKTAIEDSGKEMPLEPVGADEIKLLFTEKIAEELLALPSRPIATRLAWLFPHVLDKHRRGLDYLASVAENHGVPALTQTPRLYIGTIHSVKGAEAEHIFLFPDLSYEGMKTYQAGGPDRDSVLRTFYVGMTRARSALHICAPSSPLQVPIGKYLGG